MRKVLISTTQRCGSSWVSSMCCQLVSENQARYASGLKHSLLRFGAGENTLKQDVKEFGEEIRQESRDHTIFKTHDLPADLFEEFLGKFDDFVIVGVQRDFRDVMISRLFYNRYHLPSIGRKIESKFVMENPHLSDGELVTEFLFTREFCAWMINWKRFHTCLTHERFLNLSYEKILSKDEHRTAIESLADIIYSGSGVITTERIEEIQKETRFSNMKFNNAKNRDVAEVQADFCRKGQSKDYVNYLSESESLKLELLMGGCGHQPVKF